MVRLPASLVGTGMLSSQLPRTEIIEAMKNYHALVLTAVTMLRVGAQQLDCSSRNGVCGSYGVEKSGSASDYPCAGDPCLMEECCGKGKVCRSGYRNEEGFDHTSSVAWGAHAQERPILPGLSVERSG